MKRIVAIALTFLLILGMAACAGNDGGESGGRAKNDYPVTIGDVTISKAPSKVAVLSPSLADVIITLGSGFEVKLVARGNDCTQEALSPLPTVGNAKTLAVSTVIELEVDLVIADEALPEETMGQLTQAGIQVLVQEPAIDRETFETLYTNIGSAMLGGKNGYESALKRAQSLFLSIDDIGRLIPEEDKTVTACYVKSEDGTLAAADTLSGKLVEYAGAINIVSESANATMSADELATANPSYIFCPEGLKDSITANALFSELSAVKEGRVVELPASYMEWQGKTVLTAVIKMAETMHPDYAKDVEPSSSEPASSSTASGSASSSGPIPVSVNAKSPADDISLLQGRLIELGYLSGSPFGVYSSYTKQAVELFQKKCGITVTGIADEQTMKRLFADDAPKFI